MAKLNSELVKKIAGLMRGACGPVSAEAVARMVGRDPSDRVFRLHLHAARDSLLSGGEADFGPTGKGDGRYEIKTPEQMTQRAKRYKRAAAAKVDRAQRMAAMAAEQSDDNTARRRAENQQNTLAALRALMGGLWCCGSARFGTPVRCTARRCMAVRISPRLDTARKPKGERGRHMAIVEREYKIKGTGRLLLQADVLADPLHPAKREIEKLTSLKGKDKTPEVHERIGRLEWMANLYWDADMGPVLPADNIMKCIREGAMKNKNGKQVEQAVFVDDHAAIQYDGPRDKEALYKDSNFVLRKTVVVNRARCIRVRPVFPSWSATFRVTVDTSIMDLGKLDTAVATAGKLVGIGTWRPRFGRFVVESAAAPKKTLQGPAGHARAEQTAAGHASAWPGTSWRSQARLCLARQGIARQGKEGATRANAGSDKEPAFAFCCRNRQRRQRAQTAQHRSGETVMLPEAFRTRRYLSVTEVAEVLDVPKRTVQHWCSVGVITAVRASPKGTWRIPLAAIREQFAAQAEDLDDCRLSATCASCARDDTGYRAAR